MMGAYEKALEIIRKLPGNGEKKERAWLKRYLGSDKPTKCVKTGDIQKVAREFLKENKLTEKEFFELIDNLYSKAKIFEEIDLAAKFLGAKKDFRENIDLGKLGYWLTFTHGWAECDCLCQSNFEMEEILGRWEEWKTFLKKLNKSKNIQQKRASLVLLCKALRQSDDKRIVKLAVEQVEFLKSEKDILVTKAVSWILRSMYKNHKELLAKYLNENKESLPKIAYREAVNKVLTGKKNKFRVK
jgi:3-methyladenine DNA glycosylase AlkD